MSTSEGQNPALSELRHFIDRVPALAWSALPDCSLDFVNQRFRDYTCLSSDQLYDRKKTEERLRNENIVLREELDRSSMFEEIVGSSKPIRQLLKQVKKVAPSDLTVLILGETETGKELIARALHRRSKRANRAFIRVNCAAIPPSLLASELFGHEKGAFTGALQPRVGRFEAANGGTLFLDEIGELPMETQIALLRVLQEKEFERVGSNHPISVDVRLIAATNRDLPAAVAAGTFQVERLSDRSSFPTRVSGRYSIAGRVLRWAPRQRGRQNHPTYRQAHAGAVTGLPLARETFASCKMSWNARSSSVKPIPSTSMRAG
jgi:hypothetical protein